MTTPRAAEGRMALLPAGFKIDRLVRVSIGVAAYLYALPARAAGSSMPWEAPLQSILESIEGPVAKIVAVIVIIVTGLSLAFGETSGGFRRLIQIVFGLSIAFAASSFFLSFFSFGGGALIALPADAVLVA
jgi:type IV secretion system protein VirB2